MAALQDTGAAPAETTAVATAPAETTAVATYQRSHILAELLQKKEATAAAAAAAAGGGLRALSRRETMQLKKLLQREKEELAEAVNNAPLPPLTPQPRARNWKWILDIETSDPDDVMMLLLAAAHPQIGAKLVAVTVTPGSREQVSLVRWVLREVGLLETVRIGARDWPINAGKSGARQGQFYDAFGSLPTSDADCEPAATVLGEMCSDDVTLVTGAPVYNLQDAILAFPGNFRLGRWVAQGGFAGEGVVPAELQMDKFRGMTRCATWNFGSGVQAKAARTALDCEDTVSRPKSSCRRTCATGSSTTRLYTAPSKAPQPKQPKEREPSGIPCERIASRYYCARCWHRSTPDGSVALVLALALAEGARRAEHLRRESSPLRGRKSTIPWRSPRL